LRENQVREGKGVVTERERKCVVVDHGWGEKKSTTKRRLGKHKKKKKQKGNGKISVATKAPCKISGTDTNCIYKKREREAWTICS